MAFPTPQELAKKALAGRRQISDQYYDSGIAAAQAGTRMGPTGTGLGAYMPMGSTGGLPRSPGDVDSYIRTNYPYLAAFLGNPEIGPILRRAAMEGWDQGRLYGAVQQTGWWRQTSSAAREWEMLLTEDPAEAARRAAQTASMVQNRARSMGLNMDAGQIQALAADATKHGWTDAQVVDQLIHSVNWSTLQGGDLTALRDTVRKIGADYLVGVSESTARSYAAAIASGEMTEAGVASVMQAQAAARFGWMADQIGQGVTPSQYLMPIRDTIARELEIAPEAVDMMDPKWLGMIETRDPKTGEVRGATMNEAQLAARRKPEYWSTNAAQERQASMATAITEVFGRRGL